MKISLADLNELKLAPVEYAKQQQETKYRRLSKNRYLKFAMYRFHKQKSLESASEWLDKKIRQKFQSADDVEDFLASLKTYAESVEKLGNPTARYMDHLKILLPPYYAQKFDITGEVPRLDVTPDGYAVWLIEKDPITVDDFRLPLIKGAYAIELQASLDEIEIGAYITSRGLHQTFDYSTDAINGATDELLGLLDAIIASGIV